MYANQPRQADQPAKILILEDDLLNAFLIEDTLQFAGYEVVGPAKSIPQALMLLDSREIDAALIDLQIDDKVSFDVGRRLDELAIPWAITTAHARSFIGPQFSHVTVLTKPFAISALLEVVEELLDERASRTGRAPQNRLPDRECLAERG
jgi:DNA-binding response OmpR family regulator